jgi:hypothetical protein
MSDRERVSDERLREIGDEQKLTWGGLEEYWDLAVDLLDARDRIARAAEALECWRGWPEGDCLSQGREKSLCYSCAVRAILSGDADV